MAIPLFVVEDSISGVTRGEFDNFPSALKLCQDECSRYKSPFSVWRDGKIVAKCTAFVNHPGTGSDFIHTWKDVQYRY